MLYEKGPLLFFKSQLKNINIKAEYMDIESRICVGKIIGAHGIKGEVKIDSYTENPQDIEKYSPLICHLGKKSFSIKVRSVNKNIVIAAIKDVTNRNQSELLRGVKLYVAREQLPEIENDGEFYIEDLVGMNVFNIKNKELFGKVLAVVNYGASDILEIKSTDNKEYMYAFTFENFPEINVKEKFLTIDIPEILDE